MHAEGPELHSRTGAHHGFAARPGGSKIPQAKVQSWYLDLNLFNEYYFQTPHKYHHTASATLLYGFHQALSLIMEEGVEKRWQRHQQAHLAFVKGMEALGLRMHVAEGKRIWNLNTPCVPEGTDEAKVRKMLLDEQGIEIAGGFGPLAGKIFRIGIDGSVGHRGQRALVPAALRQCAQGKRLREGKSSRPVAAS